MGRRHGGRIRGFCRPDFDQGRAHDPIKASRRAVFKINR
jgi:hypothetical protein